jgi:hypothetical protein
VQPYKLFRYRLFDFDGEDLGEINLADPVRAGDCFFAGGGRRLRVLTVAPVGDKRSPFDGMLMVEPAPMDRSA